MTRKYWKVVKKRPITACVMVIFPLAVLIFFSGGSKTDLTITFAGYTNSATGVLTANFIVSNAASRLLYVSKTGVAQVKTEDEWKDATTTNTGVIALPANQTLLVTVSKPANCQTWRVYMTSGRPRISLAWRRIGNAYQSQPFQFEPLSYLLLAPVLRQTVTYSEELPK